MLNLFRYNCLIFPITKRMKKKLKVLTVDRKNNDGYWIAGVFDTDVEVAQYIERYLFDDAVFEVQEYDYPLEVTPLANGEYAYQILVVNPETFVIENILAPNSFKGVQVEESEKTPTRIYLSAKNAEDVRQQCLKIMSDRITHSF